MKRKFSASLILLTLSASLVIIACAASSVKVDLVTTAGIVIDGDTFHTINDTKIRLADIDAPESWESGYNESRDFLESLVTGKSVYIDIDDMSRNDAYGRLICLILVEQNSTYFLNVNKAMVDAGYARIMNYTNNEFNPYTWNLYYSRAGVAIVPEFPPNTILLLFVLTTLSICLYWHKKHEH